MTIKYKSNLTRMHNTGKEIATIFADALDAQKVLKMTHELLNLMNMNDPEAHESRMMLLGALAALGQEETDQFDSKGPILIEVALPGAAGLPGVIG